MEKIYAKECRVAVVDIAAAQSFMAAEHRQGSTTAEGRIFSLGLYHSEELLGVAQFCYPRSSAKQKKYSTELLRMAFRKNTRVVGGASKLISYYKKHYKPADLFTYQDTTGENSSVYAHCGMALAEDGTRTKKQYLVATGKTLETGSRREVLGMAYATRYGPDRILGTKLGEVLDPETGKRKSNKRLFLEELGWHIEETTGDSVWEWFNPNVTFYVYRITASDSDKYYIGVSHVKKANATEEDCLSDGYWGTGSAKFKNWKSKHLDFLQKEIIERFPRKAQAYSFEEKEIGAKWQSDPNCLNARNGGAKTSPSITGEMKPCATHGVSYHSGSTCLKCSMDKRKSEETCVKHGLTKFISGSCSSCVWERRTTAGSCGAHGEVTFLDGACIKCKNESNYSTRKCSTHGSTLFIGEKCCKCVNGESRHIGDCAAHGETLFTGDQCLKCISKSIVRLKSCPIHGETKFWKDTCRKCSNSKLISTAHCPVHGATSHYGGSCYRCAAEKSFHLANCPAHGEVKFQGERCLSCEAENLYTESECEVHGLSVHRGGKCLTCSSAIVFSTKQCKVHGLTSFRGESCDKCAHAKSFREKNCEVHGVTLHKGSTCWKCAKKDSVKITYCEIHGKETKHLGGECISCGRKSAVSTVVCPVHGETKHQYGKCTKCIAKKSLAMKECPRHGLAKHHGDSCAKCAGAKRAHKRYHSIKPNPACYLCVEVVN